MVRGFVIALVAAVLASPAAATHWPGGAKAAVALTYDDAIASQLDNAAPALDRARLRATFFLSNVKREHVERWRALAREGHELANHSLFHPCLAATYPADPRYTSERYTPAQMIREIAQQEVLLTALDGKPVHGYATPCGETMVGGEDYLEPLRAAGIVSYARSEFTSAPIANASTIDPMHIPVLDTPDNVTGAQLVALAEQAERGGGLAVYIFHGVGGDYLQTSLAAHQALIDWLAAHRGTVWVAPLGEIVAWAKAHP